MKTLVVSVYGKIMLSHFFKKAFSHFGEVLSAGPFMGHSEVKVMLREEKKQLFKDIVESKGYISKLSANILKSDIEIPAGEVDCAELITNFPEGFFPNLLFWVDTNKLFLTNLEYLKGKCLTAAYIFNTHMTEEAKQKRIEYAKNFDFVFLTFKNDLEEFKKVNENVYWVPVAFDPDYYYKRELEKLYDWCFIGQTNPYYHPSRMNILQELKENESLKGYIGSAYLEDANYFFNQSKISLNRSMNNDLNMRTFEIMGSGNMLLTDELTHETGLYDLFENNKHIVTYKDENIHEIISFYLKNQTLNEKIAYQGMKEVVEKHTYKKRTEQILRIIDNFKNKCFFFQRNTVYIGFVNDLNNIMKNREHLSLDNFIGLTGDKTIEMEVPLKIKYIDENKIMTELKVLAGDLPAGKKLCFISFDSSDISKIYSAEKFLDLLINEDFNNNEKIFLLEEIKIFFPKHPEPFILAGRTYMISHDYKAALENFKQVLDNQETVKELKDDIKICLSKLQKD